MWSNKISLLIAVLALGASVPLRAELKAGDVFPALATAGLTGEVPALAGKVAIVDFCASWCAPCKASFPSYAKLYTEFAPRGLVVVAVSVDEKAADYQAFVKKLSPPFPVLLDAKQQLVRQVQVPTMPTSYLLGRDGKVRYVHQGFHGEATERELRKEIDALLAEKE
jgi:peroxiredoxin